MNHRSVGCGSVHLYRLVLTRETGRVLRRALKFESQEKKGRLKMTLRM